MNYVDLVIGDVLVCNEGILLVFAIENTDDSNLKMISYLGKAGFERYKINLFVDYTKNFVCIPSNNAGLLKFVVRRGEIVKDDQDLVY